MSQRWECPVCGYPATTDREAKWVACSHKGRAESQQPALMEKVERKEAS